VQEAYRIEVSDIIVCYALDKGSLFSNMKDEKPHLSRQNVKAYLEFVKKYQYWIVDDWSHIKSLDKSYN